MFIRPGENGFVFESRNSNGLKTALLNIMSKTDEELFEMSEKSAVFARQITPDKWSDTLMSVLTINDLVDPS